MDTKLLPDFTDCIFWNCRGLQSKVHVLKSLLLDCPIIALAESNVNSSFKVNPYVGYHSASGNNLAKTSVLVHKRLQQAPFPLHHSKPGLHVASVHIGGAANFILICIYVEATCKLDTSTLNQLLEQCTYPTLIVGDFNSHNPSWGSARYDSRGRVIEDFLSSAELVLLNDGSPTFHRNDYTSVLDLSLASPDLARSISWSVLGDTLGSDHFPLCHMGLLHRSKSFTFKPCTNWNYFSRSFSAELGRKPFSSFDELEGLFQTSLKDATVRKAFLPGLRTPSIAVTATLQRLKTLRRRATSTGDLSIYIEIRKVQAKLRRLLKKERRDSWRRFCDSLSSRTTDAAVWKSFKSVLGLPQPSSPVQSLLLHYGLSYREAAEAFLDRFFPDLQETSDVSDDVATLDDPRISYSALDLDAPFTMRELNDVLSSVNRSSKPGPDRIPYSALTCLPWASREILLDLYNRVWDSSELPSCWSLSTVVPILKPGKTPLDFSSFRPITLSSAPLKVCERLVLTRMQTFLRVNKCLAEHQNGFVKNRSTMDCISHLVSDAHHALNSGKYMIAIFLDLKSAFDTAKHSAILKKLKALGIKGKTLRFVKAFLSSRRVHVRVGQGTSSIRKLRRGVPQGSVLSPTLFNILLHDLPKVLPPSVNYSIFADDSGFWAIAEDLEQLHLILQAALDAIANFCETWGLTISVEKTFVVPFTRRHIPEGLCNFSLKGSPLAVRKEAKYLGIQIDSKLTWSSHLDMITSAATKRLSLLRALSSTNWGTGAKRLLTFYKAYGLAKIRYGLPALVNAPQSSLRRIEIRHRQALRICLGLPRRTRCEALYRLADLPSIGTFLRQDLDQFFTSRLYFDPGRELFFKLSDPYHRSALGDFFKNSCLGKLLLKDGRLPLSIPWKLKMPRVVIHLPNIHKKTSLDSNSVKALFYTALDTLGISPDGVYTDGSWSPDSQAAGSAFYVSGLQTAHCYGLRNCTSSTAAELYAIRQALNWALHEARQESLTVFTDSKAALHAIKGHSSKWDSNPILRDIVGLSHSFLASGRNLTLVWAPSHVGIIGNEEADKAAKVSLSKPSFQLPSSLNDIKKELKKRYRETWLSELLPNFTTYRHLTSLAHVDLALFVPLPRRWETCLNRLRTGTARTKDYLRKINAASDDTCDHCKTARDSIGHFLTQCPAFDTLREECKNSLLGLSNWTLDDILTLHGDAPTRRLMIKNLLYFLKMSKRFV